MLILSLSAAGMLLQSFVNFGGKAGENIIIGIGVLVGAFHLVFHADVQQGGGGNESLATASAEHLGVTAIGATDEFLGIAVVAFFFG